jgi:hypothetical protein
MMIIIFTESVSIQNDLTHHDQQRGSLGLVSFMHFRQTQQLLITRTELLAQVTFQHETRRMII